MCADKKSRRLLVVNQHYPPDTLASGQILAELAEDLVHRHGWQVEVIAGRPLRLAEGRTWQKVASETVCGVLVHRVAAYNPEQRTVLRRLAHYISYAFLALSRGLRLSSFDLVLVMSTPPLFTGVLGMILAKRFKAKFVYNIQDLFPDILEDRLNGFSGKTLFVLLQKIAIWLEWRTDGILVIGKKMEQMIAARKKESCLLRTIPNWSDPDLIKPLGKNSEFVRKHELEDKFVVGFSGNLGLNQGLESVLDAAESLRDQSEIQWLFIGDGEKRRWLVDEIQKRQLDHCRWLPYQPKEKLSESLGSFDLGLVTVKGGISPYLIPSKLYGLMAAGSCILAAVDHDSEVWEFVESHKIGYLVPPDDSGLLAQAVVEANNEKKETENRGKEGRFILETQCARQICTSRYNEIFEELLT